MAPSLALTEPPVRRFKSRYMLRLLAAGGAAVAAAWLGGFACFVYFTSRDAPPPPPHVDAIVVLTGGPDRVEVALRLLASGAADRLLVSGAGEKTDLADLAHLAGIDPAPLEQQVTLGHAAHSTRGNAIETASWAREQRVGTLLVVTSWFHIPRALVELRRAMPTVATHPYPVGHPAITEMTHAGGARRLIGEYHKYLAALAGLTASPFVQTTLRTEASR
jgi:uncharacterized SAM-binding protein YcdF (DUF218 family)